MQEAVISKHLSRRKAREQEGRIQTLLNNLATASPARHGSIRKSLSAYDVPEWARGVKVQRRRWGFQWQVVATEERGH